MWGGGGDLAEDDEVGGAQAHLEEVRPLDRQQLDLRACVCARALTSVYVCVGGWRVSGCGRVGLGRPIANTRHIYNIIYITLSSVPIYIYIYIYIYINNNQPGRRARRGARRAS